MKRQVRPIQIVLLVVGLAIVAVAGYFVLIRPQRQEAARLQEQIAQTQAQIDRNRQLTLQARTVVPIRVADLFRVTKAIPDELDMPGVLLELNRIAEDTGIRFESISPQGAIAGSGFQAMPIALVFHGNFYELSDFLYRLRNLVRVDGGELDAQGRLFMVDSVQFSESSDGFPQIMATLNVSAFVYGTGQPDQQSAPAVTPPAPQPVAPPAPAQTEPTETQPTETQQDPDTPPAAPSDGATAAGSTEEAG